MNKEPDYVYIQTRSTSGRLHTCKNSRVASDDSIEYEGRIYKLSPFVEEKKVRTVWDDEHEK